MTPSCGSLIVVRRFSIAADVHGTLRTPIAVVLPRWLPRSSFLLPFGVGFLLFLQRVQTVQVVETLLRKADASAKRGRPEGAKKLYRQAVEDGSPPQKALARNNLAAMF